jgi:hypothetical protein
MQAAAQLPESDIAGDDKHREGTACPDIRYRVEYRGLRDNLLLMTKESTEYEKPLLVHEGPVFDVVEVKYTSETKDTRKQDFSSTDRESKEATKSDTLNEGPSVHVHGRTYIRVHSRAIINALQSVVNYYPQQELVSHPVDIDWPYAVVFHHWDKLREFEEKFAVLQSEEPTDCSVTDTYSHLALFLDFVDKKMGDRVREEHERWRQQIPKASFEMLWLLLKPGIDVYEHREEDGSKEPWVVAKVTFRLWDNSWDNYAVKKWFLDSDSTSIRPTQAEQRISRFHGEKPIHELDLLPCEYLVEHPALRVELIKRGQLFAKLQQKQCMYFEGESTDVPRQSVRFHSAITFATLIQV